MPFLLPAGTLVILIGGDLREDGAGGPLLVRHGDQGRVLGSAGPGLVLVSWDRTAPLGLPQAQAWTAIGPIVLTVPADRLYPARRFVAADAPHHG